MHPKPKSMVAAELAELDPSWSGTAEFGRNLVAAAARTATGVHTILPRQKISDLISAGLRTTMKFSVSAAFALVLVGTRVMANHNESVGDTVCAEGYAMDYLCIALGTLVDNPTVISLQGPDVHSVHCMLDVPDCAASEFEVLSPPQGGSANYSRGYRLDNSSKAELFALARAEGVCSTCNGTIERGLSIVVQGTVVAAADGDVPPTIKGSVTLSNPSAPVCTSDANPPTPGIVRELLELRDIVPTSIHSHPFVRSRYLSYRGPGTNSRYLSYRRPGTNVVFRDHSAFSYHAVFSRSSDRGHRSVTGKGEDSTVSSFERIW
jgi:hypothetical protein